MSDVVLVAIVGALPALFSAYVSLKNGKKADENGRKVDVVAAKTEIVAVRTQAVVTQQQEIATQQQVIAVEAAGKQKEIHLLVNSNLAKVKADLEEAKTEIAVLHDLLRELTARTIAPKE